MEEHPMEESAGELYFSTHIDENVILCISPLTDECALAAGLPSNQLGYFLYERSSNAETEHCTVIARIESEEAAFRMKNMLGLE